MEVNSLRLYPPATAHIHRWRVSNLEQLRTYARGSRLVSACSNRHSPCSSHGVTLDPTDAVTQLTEQIIGAAIDVHRHLGPGLLESTYQACLEYELAQRHVPFRAQLTLPITYRDVFIDRGYRIDLLVENCVIVEVKAVETLTPLCAAQLITYLKLKGCAVGLLLNFNVAVLRHGVRRFTNRPAAQHSSTAAG
jgi:GxxExxY protein